MVRISDFRSEYGGSIPPGTSNFKRKEECETKQESGNDCVENIIIHHNLVSFRCASMDRRVCMVDITPNYFLGKDSFHGSMVNINGMDTILDGNDRIGIDN